MGITGVGSSLTGAWQYADKTQKNSASKSVVNKTGFQEQAVQMKADVSDINSMQELSEEEEMTVFKEKFYEDLSKITNHNTVSNAAVNISDAAFRAMKEDPKYREKILSLIERDLGASYAPRNCSVLITVGATLDEYRGDSWPIGYDSEFHKRSQDSFYKKGNEKKDEQKEILEAYQEKRVRSKKIQQRILDEKFARLEIDSRRFTEL